MKARYTHTNIIAKDWERLAGFYERVFGCVRVQPERHLSGEWLEKGTGVSNARFSGIHLRVPGYGEDGPSLEIFQYSKNEPKLRTAANREGFAHIAFEVDDVEQAMEEVLENGGNPLGSIVSTEVKGTGVLTFVYVSDPEDNIIELQAWRSPSETERH